MVEWPALRSPRLMRATKLDTTAVCSFRVKTLSFARHVLDTFSSGDLGLPSRIDSVCSTKARNGHCAGTRRLPRGGSARRKSLKETQSAVDVEEATEA